MFLALGTMADQNEEISGGRKESNCVRCRNHSLKVVLRGHKQYCPYAACTCDKCRFTAEQQRQMRLQNAIRRSEANDRTGAPGRRPRNAASAAPAMVSPPQQHQQQQLPQPQQVIQQQVVQVQQQQPVAQQHQPHQIIVTTAVAVPIPNSDQRNGGSPHGMYPLLLLHKTSSRFKSPIPFFLFYVSRRFAEEKKMLFDCSSELLKKFRYPWEMMPIMYALAKYANGNIDEIMQKIDEGKLSCSSLEKLPCNEVSILGQFAVNEQLRLQTLNMYFGAAQNSNALQATRECG